MKSFAEYINENLEELGGKKTGRNRQPVRFPFTLHYYMSLVVSEDGLKIENYSVERISEETNDVKNAFIDALRPVSRIIPSDLIKIKDYEHEVVKQDENEHSEIFKKNIPQGRLRDIDLMKICEAEAIKKLREYLSTIDPTMKQWELTLDKHDGKANSAVMRIKDLLAHRSGILSIKLDLQLAVEYTVEVLPVYFKKRDEIARFKIEDFDIDRVTIHAPLSTVSFDVYDCRKQREKNISFTNKDIPNAGMKPKYNFSAHLKENVYPSMFKFIESVVIRCWEVSTENLDNLKALYKKYISKNA